MDRIKDKGREGKKTAAARMYRLSAEEDSMFGRKTGLQALPKVAHSLRVQGYDAQGAAPDGLHGNAGQATQAHGGESYQDYTGWRNEGYAYNRTESG